ncbi:regulator [Streptacidiphilus pinicola]|uniref:Regulator n=1 Tax=Streptacidiphilus pinicola TaxID=2219663 RepID=A0A2X0IZL7_9ACTN|nr:regulator [Streptacidiphilus pinicola]
MDSLPYQGLSHNNGPSIQTNPFSWVWQRPNGVSIGGTRYKRGVTVVAPSNTVIDLNRSCKLFTASVGIDDMTLGLGSAKFTVEDAATGAVLWRSPVIHGGDPAVPVSVPLGGVSAIKLVVHGSHGFIGGQIADWADAGFTC